MLGAEDDGDADDDRPPPQPSPGGRGGGREEDFLILPENWDSVQVFLALNTSWRIDGFNGIYLGLDRPAIESTLRLMGIAAERHREILEDLRIMESAALGDLNRE